MNKKKLYENIITSIAKSVKTKINESYSSSSDSYSETIDTEGEKLTVVIGDPCYVLDKDIYENCWGPDYEDGIITDDNNIIGFVHGTAFGDGSYDSMSGKTYGVDAGALGIFDSSYCKDLNELRNDDDVKVIDVDDADSHTIKLSYEDGTFTFYIDNDNVEEIYTGDSQEDDEYDEETDSDDYFYDENDDEDLY